MTIEVEDTGIAVINENGAAVKRLKVNSDLSTFGVAEINKGNANSFHFV